MHIVTMKESKQVLNTNTMVNIDHSLGDVLALIESGKFGMEVANASVVIGERHQSAMSQMTSTALELNVSTLISLNTNFSR